MATTAEDFRDDEGRSDDVPPRSRRWVIVATGTACFLLFEMTASPGLAIAAGCLKFGWDGFRSSRWLLKHDPDPVRGRVCSRFYLAGASWKISMVAIGALFLIPILLGLASKFVGAGPKAQAPALMSAIGGALMVVVFGLIVSAWFSAFAVVSALRNGVRVWVGRKTNRAKAILLSAILFLWFTIGLPVVGIGLAFMPAGGPMDNIKLGLFMVFAMGIIPVGTLWSLDVLERRMIAGSPADCGVDWPGHTSPWRL